MAVEPKYAKKKKKLTPEERDRQAKLEKRIKRGGLIIFILIALGFAINAYYAYFYLPAKASESMLESVETSSEK